MFACLPGVVVPGRPCARASRLYAGRSAAGSCLAPPLPVRGSCCADTTTAATAWPDPSRDPRLCCTVAAWTHQHIHNLLTPESKINTDILYVELFFI